MKTQIEPPKAILVGLDLPSKVHVRAGFSSTLLIEESIIEKKSAIIDTPFLGTHTKLCSPRFHDW